MYTRASPTDILARKSVRRTKVCGLCRELCRRAEPTARAAAGRLPRAPRQADFCARRTRRLPLEDPRAEVGEEVRVGVVGVRVGPVDFKLNAALRPANCKVTGYIAVRNKPHCYSRAT